MIQFIVSLTAFLILWWGSGFYGAGYMLHVEFYSREETEGIKYSWKDKLFLILSYTVFGFLTFLTAWKGDYLENKWRIW